MRVSPLPGTLGGLGRPRDAPSEVTLSKLPTCWHAWNWVTRACISTGPSIARCLLGSPSVSSWSSLFAPRDLGRRRSSLLKQLVSGDVPPVPSSGGP